MQFKLILETSQYHEMWCDKKCCEEDVHWVVKNIPGKGRGIMAIKNIPPLTRILVDSHYKNENRTHETCSRTVLFNHSCSPNAVKIKWGPGDLHDV